MNPAVDSGSTNQPGDCCGEEFVVSRSGAAYAAEPEAQIGNSGYRALEVLEEMTSTAVCIMLLTICPAAVAQTQGPKGATNSTSSSVVVTELKAGAVYEFNLGSSGSLITSGKPFSTKSGDWEKYEENVDFSPMFVGKKFLFKGTVKEFVCGYHVEKEAGGGWLTPDHSIRIVSAAPINYDPASPESSPDLSEAGVVEIDSNGFATGKNVKSGWINMPATIRLKDSKGPSTVQLTGVTFWVTDGGKEWLSLSIDHATTRGSASEVVPVKASIMKVDKPLSPGATAKGSSTGAVGLIVVGKHKFLVDLRSLTGKLKFTEIAP